MNQNKQIAGNLFYLFSGEFIASALAFVTTVRLARVLDTTGFGQWSFVLAIIVYLTILVDMGLSTFGAREIARESSKALYYIMNILTMRSILACAFFAALVIIVSSLRMPFEMKLLYCGAALWLFPQAWNIEFAFQGLEQMYGVSLWRIGQQFFYFIFVMLFIHDQTELWHVPYYRAGGGFIAVVILWRLFKKIQPGSVLRFIDLKAWGNFVKVSSVMAASIVVNKIYYTFDTILLGILDTPETVAWYNAGYKVILLFIGIAGLVQFAFAPAFSRFREDHDHIEKPFRIFALLLAFFGIVISGMLMLMSQELILWIYGETYLNATVVLNILTLSLLCVFLNTIFLAPLLYTGFHKQYLYAILAGSIANVFLNIVFIPLFSYNGAAAVTVVCNILILICGFLQFKKHLYTPGRITFEIIAMILGALFIALAVLIIFGSHWYSAFIYLLLFVALFIGRYYREFKATWKQVINWIS